ncbi:MFS transporter [Acetobacter oeni]|uniref:MFS transporter n=1 Tax=Acetobacter oeni TaxID=304077 RepID=A0A511XL27_9PROT|nr:MFS transporter [Acetobacter oeni]MBB3883213.1 MFS family permease [Acetobacter oeni]NHO19279.1 MFS transporter [Acetobacter oeni]GBR07299.1 major facilitator superfamily transporter [Acetobacter oeni LMG 21952]GEN63638.1 MFS transporter [Acetobacter oeni]
MLKTDHHTIRACASSFVGTALEFYDYYVYALASSLILGKVFFPSSSPLVTDLNAYGTLAAGFLARPFAGLLCGMLGDRYGRKKVLTFTVVGMGAATTAIGLLPGYASIGFLAPVLLVLLRILQGLAVGGEWGGAVLLASEHAPERWKIFAASFPQLGSPAGMLMALASFRGASSLGAEAFADWAWRIPFLLGGLIALGCFVLRRQVEETPDFLASRREAPAVREPLSARLAGQWGRIFCAGLAVIVGSAGFFFVNTFLLGYAPVYMHVSRQFMLDAMLIATVLQLLTQPLAAWIAQKTGEVRFLLGLAGLCILLPFPMFRALETHRFLPSAVAISATIVCLSAFYAVVAGFMANAFPARVRYTAISIAYQTSASLITGVTPIVGTLIASRFGADWTPLALLFSAMAVCSVAGVLGLARSRAETPENAVLKGL